jgi:adenosylcobinamide-GDP ribazoletransferase
MRAALSLLTIAPVGGRPGRWSAACFPLVGCLLGLAVGGAWHGAAEVWGPLVAASLVVLLDLALTGMLHADGLADSADGLLPHMDRERRLEVMRAPDVGAFGVAVVAAFLLVRVAGFSELAPSVALVVAVWCASRTAMALTPAVMPYARAKGLASAFFARRSFVALYGVAVAFVVAVVFEGAHGAVAVGAALVGAACVAALSWRRLGGFTGDVLGAAGLVGETFGLVAAGVRW